MVQLKAVQTLGEGADKERQLQCVLVRAKTLTL